MSSFSSKALFSVEDLTNDEWLFLHDKAKEFSTKQNILKDLNKYSVGMIFFESSSRTRWSFQKAALDLNLRSYSTVVDQTTSLSKGETLRDSLELFFNLGYDVVVGRTPEVPELKELIEKNQVCYINAGSGSAYHPTQAFLDHYTWVSETSFKAPKVLIIGDVKHSRVARSHFRFAKIMGYEVGVLSPKSLELSETEADLYGVKKFQERNAALSWANIVYLLRNQKERHGSDLKNLNSFSAFDISELKKDQFIMHPGPFIRGEDLEDNVLEDERSLIFKQKRNGVFCRAALLWFLLEGRK